MTDQSVFKIRERTGRTVVALWIVALYVVFLSAVLFTLSLYHFQREIETAYIEEFRETTNDLFVPHHCNLTILKGEIVDSTLVFVPCIPQSLSAAAESGFQPNRFIRLQNESAGYAIERQQIEGRIRQFIDSWLSQAIEYKEDGTQQAYKDATEEIRVGRAKLIDQDSQRLKADLAAENVIRQREALLSAKKVLDGYENPGLFTALGHGFGGEPASWQTEFKAAIKTHKWAVDELASAESTLSVARATAQSVALSERNKVFEWLRLHSSDSMQINVLKVNLEKALERLQAVNAKLEKIDSVIRNFKKIQQKDGDFYNSLFSLFVPVEVIDNIWELPTIFMSMVLVLAMGGLGSLITVTIKFLGDQEQRSLRLSSYFFRPLLGTIVALAAYIGVKSGQMSVAGDGVNELSPFLLSFLGVLAGIMSERIYRRLVDYGEKII